MYASPSIGCRRSIHSAASALPPPPLTQVVGESGLFTPADVAYLPMYKKPV